MKKNSEIKLDGLISAKRAREIEKTAEPSDDRLEAISGMFSVSSPETDQEKSVRERIEKSEEFIIRERIRASEEYIAKELAEAIERDAKEKRKTTVKEKDKKRMSFIVNDDESVALLKQYCYLHDLRIQDVFEVMIKGFLKNPDLFEIPTRKY